METENDRLTVKRNYEAEEGRRMMRDALLGALSSMRERVRPDGRALEQTGVNVISKELIELGVLKLEDKYLYQSVDVLEAAIDELISEIQRYDEPYNVVSETKAAVSDVTGGEAFRPAY